MPSEQRFGFRNAANPKRIDRMGETYLSFANKPMIAGWKDEAARLDAQFKDRKEGSQAKGFRQIVPKLLANDTGDRTCADFLCTVISQPFPVDSGMMLTVELRNSAGAPAPPHAVAIFRETADVYFLFDANFGTFRLQTLDRFITALFFLFLYGYDEVQYTIAQPPQGSITLFHRTGQEPDGAAPPISRADALRKKEKLTESISKKKSEMAQQQAGESPGVLARIRMLSIARYQADNLEHPDAKPAELFPNQNAAVQFYDANFDGIWNDAKRLNLGAEFKAQIPG